MANVKFKSGEVAALSQSIDNGTLFATTDSKELYIDIEDQRIALPNKDTINNAIAEKSSVSVSSSGTSTTEAKYITVNNTEYKIGGGSGGISYGLIYGLTITLTNCSCSNIPTYIESGSTITLTIIADSGCTLPDSITVTGASYTWTQATGTLVLTNATSNVTITITSLPPALTWFFNDPPSENMLISSLTKAFNFTCDGVVYDGYEYYSSTGVFGLNYATATSVIDYYSGDGWIDQKYRTITLLAPATGELLTWLQSVAVLQQ